MSVIYLIRHAQASFGSDEYDQLSDLGVEQSRILGEYFRDLEMEFQGVYSGSMKRQLDTARKVMSHIRGDESDWEPHPALEFNEYDAPSIIKSQMPYMIEEDPLITEDPQRLFTDRKYFQHVFNSAMKRWLAGACDGLGIETWPEFTQRVRAGLTRLMEEHGSKKRISIFTSGGAICAAMQIALGLSDDESMRLILLIRNTSVTTFWYGNDQLSLSCFNSTTHLELLKDPELITYR
jgi:broad specificity phosphatase PhoE